jgi:alkylated DNA repair protein alkB family protein 6
MGREAAMEFNLEAARIKSLPDDAFYIADFITEEEEEMLQQKVCFAITNV